MKVIILMSMLLAGCCSAPPAPVEVRIPVKVPCVKGVPERPQFEFDRMAPTASDGGKILALARDWPRGRNYEALLEAVIAGCR
jgi:starvation-inducible outer membrane lipoprotein